MQTSPSHSTEHDMIPIRQALSIDERSGGSGESKREDCQGWREEIPGGDEELGGIWTYSKSSSTKGLPASTAPSWTVRPYIHWGYREAQTLRQSFASLLFLHNESGNVFTHLLGLFIFMYFFARDVIFSDMAAHHRMIASLYIGAAQFCMGTSALFHLLSPVSKLAYDRALQADMSGIAALITASFLVGIHYGYWCHVTLGRVYLSVVFVLSLIAMVWPYVPALFRNFRASVIFFASFVTFALVPLFHWVYLVGGLSSPQADLFFYKLLQTFALYGAGFFFYLMQYPERLYPGGFDLVASSHQLWHVGVLLGALRYYDAMSSYASFRAHNNCSVTEG